MKRSVTVFVVIVAIGLVAGVLWWRQADPSQAAGPGGATASSRGGSPSRGGGGGGRGGGGGGFGGPGGGFGGPRMPMAVEIGAVTRADMSQQITVVGNLIGQATVAAAPKVSGRLETVSVRMGDSVRRGQPLAKIEDREILEQVKQAEASYAVSAATIRQREADLRFAQNFLDRTRNLHERELIPRQTLDDAEARHQASTAQLELAQAQNAQSQARLDELKINLANTIVTSPVDGFVGSRILDPGAWVTPNTAFISVVDIGIVRLVANVVERDLRRIAPGLESMVEVDAYPGEQFIGRVAHVAPVLDPATRTAQIEVDIRNPNFRLKPGMYAKITMTVEHRPNTLVVPSSAAVEQGTTRGVYLATDDATATFKPVEFGLTSPTQVEVLSGLTEGTRVITTGAAALRQGDKIVLPSEGDGPTAGSGGGERGARGRGRQGQGS